MSKTSTLIEIKPSTMKPEAILEWAKNVAYTTSEKCAEAENYYNSLKKHHANIATLLGTIVDLNKKIAEGITPSEEETEELASSTDALVEVVEAINSLRNDSDLMSENSVEIEDLGQDLFSQADKEDAEKASSEESAVFLKNYNRLKEQLDLKTQSDVARLTGIDRRYISIIEAGKHRPQFKTLKKLADAFGVEIDDLCK